MVFGDKMSKLRLILIACFLLFFILGNAMLYFGVRTVNVPASDLANFLKHFVASLNFLFIGVFFLLISAIFFCLIFEINDL